MLVHQLAPGLRLIGLLCQGLHFDGHLAVQEQLRAGASYIPAVAQSNTLSLSEIIAPSVQGHMTTAKGSQDLLLR